MQISEVVFVAQRFGQFMAAGQFWGNLWRGLNGRELTEALSRHIPNPHWAELPYLTTAAVCSNLTSPNNAQILRRQAWSKISSSRQMLSFADMNIYLIWPHFP